MHMIYFINVPSSIYVSSPMITAVIIVGHKYLYIENLGHACHETNT